MHDAFFSPYIVPLGAFALGIAYAGFDAWKKVRDRELSHESEWRQKDMEHQLKLKEMEWKIAQAKQETHE
jgi:hypothetical protein